MKLYKVKRLVSKFCSVYSFSKEKKLICIGLESSVNNGDLLIKIDHKSQRKEFLLFFHVKTGKIISLINEECKVL